MLTHILCFLTSLYFDTRSSAIFNAKKQALQTIETKAVKDQEDEEADKTEEEEGLGREKIDLTLEQTALTEEDGADEMDDFDLLDATIDPTDTRSMKRRAELEQEIEYEKVFIKSKMVWKLAFSEENPFKIPE